eukprot:COSAG02_NODE_3356_length_6878_cov_14.421596_11_plen_84_part_00
MVALGPHAVQSRPEVRGATAAMMVAAVVVVAAASPVGRSRRLISPKDPSSRSSRTRRSTLATTSTDLTLRQAEASGLMAEIAT